MEQTRKPSASGHRLRKRLLVAGAIVLSVIILLVATVFVLAYYRGSRMIKAYLEAKVSDQTRGLYTLKMKNLNLILFPGRLRIEGLSLVPDTARYRELLQTDTLSSMLLTLNIGKLVVTDFDVVKAIRDKEIDLKKILVSSPEIRIDEFDVPPGRIKKEEKRTMKLSLSLPKGISLVDIGVIRLEKGTLLFVDHRKDTLRETAVPEFSVQADRIHIDSTASGNLFNAEDIRFIIKGITKTSKNNLITVSLGEIGLSTGKKELYVKDFHVKPEVSRVDYGRKLGYQTDWMEVTAREIRLSGLNIPQLLLNEYFEAARLTVDSIVLDDYRDKRNPSRKNWKPPMPHEALTNLNMQIRIDTVEVINGKLSYTEQPGDKAGTIFFDQVSVKAWPLSNDSAMMADGFTMKVQGNARLMGSGAVRLEVDFPMPARNGSFSYSARLGNFDMTQLNPFIAAQIPAKIVSGTVDRLVIPKVYANSRKAQGKLILYYHDLKMDLPPQTDKNWEHFKKSVLSFAANTYVAQSNPNQQGKLREGIIYFERDSGKSIFNYLWKSVFSGIKSTVNVNSKEQKEIKKDARQKSKEQDNSKKKH